MLVHYEITRKKNNKSNITFSKNKKVTAQETRFAENKVTE